MMQNNLGGKMHSAREENAPLEPVQRRCEISVRNGHFSMESNGKLNLTNDTFTLFLPKTKKSSTCSVHFAFVSAPDLALTGV